MIRIIEAEFITSAQKIDDSLPDDTSEVVFLGRSNVGKSSFINALANKKSLAKSSSTPGKTRLINFFDIKFLKDGEKFIARFVDLPGFGYAKVSKSIKNEWQKNLTDFLQKRKSIRLFVHLVDSRHPNLDIDNMVHDFLNANIRADQKMVQIFTKSDKLNQKEKNALKRSFPDSIFTSNSKKIGLNTALIEIFNSLFQKEKND
ncbi:MAG: YihA family ribosome biogenesis GTP-binding protein [Epsilonproteobacteria bacterium]|nr:YihA family ribosome biogenesis GTP-binding protein [Campylobacterota bacterium]